MSRLEGHVLLEDVRIIFRNFAGAEGQFNREGDRNFCVLLDQNTAEQMEADGWNVKALRAREEGDPDQPYIHVSVGFKHKPPLVVMVTSRGRTTLTEDELNMLDWVDIKQVDLTFRPYNWAVGGKVGVKAYLKSLFVTIHEDELEIKYADVPQLGSRSHDYKDIYIDAEIIEEQLALPRGGRVEE